MSPLLVMVLATLLDLGNVPGNNCLPAIKRHARALLEKYRYPRDADLQDYWDFYIQEYGEVPFCDSADLNEDGVVDYLAILLPREPPGVLVVAMVSSVSGGARSAHVLFESSAPRPAPDEMVVEVVPKGVHKYMCAYKVDDADAASPVTLLQPAARFWARAPRESTALHYLFSWVAEETTFRRIEVCQ